MPVIIPVAVIVVMPVPIMIAATTVAETLNYATGDSLAYVFLRPARQRQRTGYQCEPADGERHARGTAVGLADAPLRERRGALISPSLFSLPPTARRDT